MKSDFRNYSIQQCLHLFNSYSCDGLNFAQLTDLLKVSSDDLIEKKLEQMTGSSR